MAVQPGDWLATVSGDQEQRGGIGEEVEGVQIAGSGEAANDRASRLYVRDPRRRTLVGSAPSLSVSRCLTAIWSVYRSLDTGVYTAPLTPAGPQRTA